MADRMLRVKWAVDGRPVPLAESPGPGRVIRGEAVEVPDTRYYRQRILKGDLVEVAEMPDTTAAPALFEEEGEGSEE
jgi:hypothetical protein